jgi:Xanthine dehydrogenase, iron-sulfur cluster and FAD-binding subunit A
LSHVPELATISDEGREVSLGAAVTYTSALPMLAKHFPTLQTYLSRLGSVQIRNMGTLGGNIGTASPIGDFLPLLLALDAELTLCSQASGERRLPLEGFFLGYRKTALRPDEIIKTIHLPKLAPGDHLFADKISKRRDQDISAVCAAYRVRLEGARIVDVRLAYGGMAAIPKRATQAEIALKGRDWDETAIAAAAAALPLDFTPLSDARASGEYRSLVAANLLTRFYWRVTGSDAPVEIDAA